MIVLSSLHSNCCKTIKSLNNEHNAGHDVVQPANKDVRDHAEDNTEDNLEDILKTSFLTVWPHPEDILEDFFCNYIFS